MYCMKPLLYNKKGLVTGIINQHSIAYSIAKTLKSHGAHIALSYQSESILVKNRDISKELCSDFCGVIDFSDHDSVDAYYQNIQKEWDNIDFIVHSVAFAHKTTFTQPFVNISREHFLESMNISCYSLIELSNKFAQLMNNTGSILTVTYGSNRVVPGYNLMGVVKSALESTVKYLAYDLGSKNIRVNAISSGPIKTVSSSVVPNIKSLTNKNYYNTPLNRNLLQSHVANASLYLLSDLSEATTGEVHFVDLGANIMNYTGKI